MALILPQISVAVRKECGIMIPLTGDAGGEQGDERMTMQAEAQPQKVRRVRGRHGVPNRLQNVDMRSLEGRSYKRHLRALLAEYGEAEIERCRELEASNYLAKSRRF